MFNDRKQVMFRFLKEKKIYKNQSVMNALKNRIDSNFSISFFDNSMSWANTNEGHSFWLKVQCDFILFIVNNKLEKLFGEQYVKRYFYRLLSEGYFTRSDLTKESQYYIDFREKYISLYEN